MKLTLHPITLQLKEVFTISRGSYSERKALIVELSVGGVSGFGEASEHEYYGVTIEDLMDKSAALRSIVESYEFDNPTNFWYFLQPYLENYSFLQCAFDNAAHDLFGKIKQQPCHQIWKLKTDNLPKSSYTLSIDTIDKMVKKLKKTNFDIYKIKLGRPNDMEILKELRQHTDAIFRIDANCAWTAEETIQYSFEMKKLGVEFIEQPLKADDWEGMKKVHKESVLPIIADESCIGEKDVSRCAGSFQGINIKLMKCGGISPALRMIEKARSLNLKIMCGCMIESSVGIAAIAQLLPLLDYVDMDGTLLLANDIATGAQVLEDGRVVLSEENGLGIALLGF